MTSLVSVQDVAKDFPLSGGGHYLALKGIDLEIRKGEFISLIGHSGCGKSTLLNMIAGLDLPTDGTVLLDGEAVRRPGPDKMVVFQNYSLLPWLSVRENIALAVDEVMPELTSAERHRVIEEHITMVGLSHAADKSPLQLSGGMRQRVAMARALCTDPKLLLLDEPSSGLNVEETDDMAYWIQDIRDELGVTVLMVEHDMSLVSRVSDRVLALNFGKPIAEGSPAEVQAHPDVLAAYLGLAS